MAPERLRAAWGPAGVAKGPVIAPAARVGGARRLAAPRRLTLAWLLPVLIGLLVRLGGAGRSRSCGGGGMGRWTTTRGWGWARPLRGLALALGLAGAAALPVAATARVPPLILRELRLGQVRLAHRDLLRALAKEGNDPDLLAIFGATLARAGFPTDAVTTFELVRGSAWYEQHGLGDHADALRELGRGDEGVALRQGVLLLADRSAAFDAQVMVEVAEDYLSVGELGEAERAAEVALAWGPASPLPYVTLARVRRAAGDREGAWEAYFFADRAADRRVGVLVMLRAQLLLDDGLYEQARGALATLPRGRTDNLQLWALRAEIDLQEGIPEDALGTLQHSRLGFQGAPVIAEAEARALSALGRADEARAVADDALRAAPDRASLKKLSSTLQR